MADVAGALRGVGAMGSEGSAVGRSCRACDLSRMVTWGPRSAKELRLFPSLGAGIPFEPVWICSLRSLASLCLLARA